MNNYYNTTLLMGEDLLKEIENAKTQTEKIKLFFQHHPINFYTPSQICEKVFNNSIPLTSVRRAITNLTDGGTLIKTDKQKPGAYGKLNFCWKLKLNV